MAGITLTVDILSDYADSTLDDATLSLMAGGLQDEINERIPDAGDSAKYTNMALQLWQLLLRYDGKKMVADDYAKERDRIYQSYGWQPPILVDGIAVTGGTGTTSGGPSGPAVDTTARTAAASAQRTANAARTEADNAQTTATNAGRAAANAAQDAANAQATATRAENKADQNKSRIDNLPTGGGGVDQTARDDAAAAQRTATAAQKAAESAQSTADDAEADAESAQTTATQAKTTADAAKNDAAAAKQAADNAQTTADAATTRAEATEIANSAVNTGIENGVQIPARAAPGNEISGVQQYFGADFYAPNAEDGQILTAKRNGSTTWEDPATGGTGADSATVTRHTEEIDELNRRTSDINVSRDVVSYRDYTANDAAFAFYALNTSTGAGLVDRHEYDVSVAASTTWRNSFSVPANSAFVVRVRKTVDPFDYALGIGAADRDVEDGQIVGSGTVYDYYFLGVTTVSTSVKTREKVHDTHTTWEGELGGPAGETINNYPLYNDVAVFPPGIPDANWPDHLLILIGERLRPGKVTGIAVTVLGQTLTLDDAGAKDGISAADTGHAMLRYTISSQIKTSLNNNSQVGDAPKNVDVTFTLEGGETYRHRIRFPVQESNFESGGGADQTARDAAAAAQTRANQSPPGTILTQAQYTALATKVSGHIYYINE